MNHDSVQEAQELRREVYRDQKENRKHIRATTDAIMMKADPRKLFASWQQATADRAEFLTWLQDQMLDMKDGGIKRVSSWLLRNTNALGGMNTYLEYMGEKIIDELVKDGVFDKAAQTGQQLANGIDTIAEAEITQQGKG